MAYLIKKADKFMRGHGSFNGNYQFSWTRNEGEALRFADDFPV